MPKYSQRLWLLSTLIGLSLLAKSAHADAIDIRYDNFPLAGSNPIYGASADVIYNGNVISSPGRLESSTGIVGALFLNGINNIDTMRIDLTQVSNYDDLTRSGLSEPGPNILFINTNPGNTYDGSLQPNQDIANANRIYNNIEITGNRATANTPQSSFGIIGKGVGPSDTQGVDITLYSRGISLTNATLTNSIDTATWYNSDCITTIGGSCHDGNITFVLGGGAYHSDAYIQLNNGALRMGNQVLINTFAPLTLQVGGGENILNLSSLTNMSNASGTFTMTGSSSERSVLSIVDTAQAITSNPDNVRTSARYLNLGHTANIEFADLYVNHSSISASIDANWTFNQSSISMLEPNTTSALRLGNVQMSATNIRARSFHKFIYLGYQTTGNSGTIGLENVSVDFTDAADSLFEARGDITLAGYIELLGKNPGVIGSEYSTNTIDLIGDTTLTSGSTLNIDNTQFTNLTTQPNSLLRFIDGGVVTMDGGTIQGDFTGSGEIIGIGTDLSFNSEVTIDRIIRQAPNSYSRSTSYSELILSSKDIQFGPASNLTLDARLFLSSPQVFQTDNLSVRLGDLDSLPSITLNLQENQFGGLPTSSQLDGAELMVVEVVDLSDPILSTGATLNFDPTTDTTIMPGANVPALIELNAIEVPAYNVDIGGGLTRVANVSVQMTELPATALTSHPGAAQSANSQNSANLVANGSNTSTALSNALSSLTNQQVSPHLNSLQPEAYASHMSIGLEQNHRVITAVLRRIGMYESGAQLPQNSQQNQATVSKDTESISTLKNLWLDSFYVDGSYDRDGDLAAFDYQLYNYLIGSDITSGPEGRVGFYTGYGYYRMTDHQASDQRFTTDVFNLGLYANKETAHFDLRAMIGYAYGDNDHERTTQLGNLRETAQAEFDAHNFLSGIVASKVLILSDKLYIRPELGQYYTYHYQESFKEKNAPTTGLVVDSADTHAFITTLGAEISTQGYYGSKFKVRPVVFSRAEYDWLAEDDSAHELKAGLIVDPSTREKFAGQTRGHASLSLGAGIEGYIGQNCSFRIDGFQDWQEHGDAAGIGGNFEFRYLW